MAVGETAGQGPAAPRRQRRWRSPPPGRARRRRSTADGADDGDRRGRRRCVKEADPELERLLAEEEEIERRTRQHHETPQFHGGRGLRSHDVDAPQGPPPQDAARPHDRHGQGWHALAFGDYGIQALEPGWITNRQIEAARIAMTRHIKRGGKVWINVFPDKPVTQKPAETRMGSGKGNPEQWVAVVKPGPRDVRALGCARDRSRAKRCASRSTSSRSRRASSCVRTRAVAMTKAQRAARAHRRRARRPACARRRRSCSSSGSTSRPVSSTTPREIPQVQARDRAHRDADARARDRGARSADRREA